MISPMPPAIPFAEPPVGALRFAPPVLMDNISTSALDATQFGPACPQMNVSLPSQTAHAIALTDSVRLSPQ